MSRKTNKTALPEEGTTLWQMYEQGREYMDVMGLSIKLPRFVKFYEGDQWPAPTARTAGLPRPVVNLIRMICRNKKSAILATKPKIVYRAEVDGVDVQALNDFSDYITAEIGQAELDRRGVLSAVIKGTYIYHYYWDAEAVGKDGTQAGGVRCELLDPLSVVFSDPTQSDEQKQKWIILVTRQSVESVRAKVDKDINTEDIVPDEAEDDPYDKHEQDGSKLCTVLTRYFRKDGEVYCEKATRTSVVNAPFPIAPDVAAAKDELFGKKQPDVEGEAVEPDAPDAPLPDNGKDGMKPLKGDRSKAYLYPIVVGQYEEREGSIYGVGEVEGLIPNQKYVNTLLAMLLLNTMTVAWDKYVVRSDALRNQTITNEPGQVLTDYSREQVGIKRLGATALSSMPLSIVDTITTLTRTVTGSTEVMSGETIGAGISGAAIALLQEQAKQPIDDLREAFWGVKEKQGRVLAQFYRLFYQGAEYVREADGVDETGKKTKIRELAAFDAAAMEGMKFDVVCEATTGTRASSASDIALLEMLLGRGDIDLTTFLELYPADALSNRSELIERAKAMKEDVTRQTQAALEQVKAEYQAAQAAMAEDQKLAERAASLVKENQQLGMMLAALYAESKEKLDAANASINAGNAKNEELMRDATDFAVALDQVQRKAQ